MVKIKNAIKDPKVPVHGFVIYFKYKKQLVLSYKKNHKEFIYKPVIKAEDLVGP